MNINIVIHGMGASKDTLEKLFILHVKKRAKTERRLKAFATDLRKTDNLNSPTFIQIAKGKIRPH